MRQAWPRWWIVALIILALFVIFWVWIGISPLHTTHPRTRP